MAEPNAGDNKTVLPEPVVTGRTAKAPAPGPGASITFAIEISTPRNASIIDPDDKSYVRGRWARKNLLGQTYDERFALMPDLPGMVYVVNTARRAIKRFDPLAQPENRRVLEAAQRILLELTKTKKEPVKPRLWENCTDDRLKTFVFWARQLLDGQLAVEIEGAGYVPEFAQIKAMPGLVHLHRFDSSAATKKAVPNDDLIYVRPDPADAVAFPGFEDIPEPSVTADFDDE